MYSKKFPFALQTIFSIHNLGADNFFQPTTACEQFFYKKGNPPIKNNGPSSMNNLTQKTIILGRFCPLRNSVTMVI